MPHCIRKHSHCFTEMESKGALHDTTSRATSNATASLYRLPSPPSPPPPPPFFLACTHREQQTLSRVGFYFMCPPSGTPSIRPFINIYPQILFVAVNSRVSNVVLLNDLRHVAWCALPRFQYCVWCSTACPALKTLFKRKDLLVICTNIRPTNLEWSCD